MKWRSFTTKAKERGFDKIAILLYLPTVQYEKNYYRKFDQTSDIMLTQVITTFTRYRRAGKFSKPFFLLVNLYIQVYSI